MTKIPARTIAGWLGACALALVLGALGFQYIGHILPCEICHWQRWPHIAAAVVGLGGGLLIAAGVLPRSAGMPLAWLALLLIALSGAIGVYHAGVEWQLWKGPTACTGAAFSGAMDLNAPVVRCDAAAWRLFGLSLAGYNVLFSFGIAGIAAWLLANRSRNT